MAYLILFALLLVPLVEVTLFIVIGGVLGLWPTLCLAIGTAIAGTALIRQQGLGILTRAQAEFANNHLPINELFDALCLFIAGTLLLTPGFATDIFGASLLVPPFRVGLRAVLGRIIQGHRSPGAGTTRADNGPIIDGEYEDVSADESKTQPRLDNR
tara:strand:- start:3318 stop:3788 length:471 start_codon:yes stop_codon:yes gene_type:complete